MTEGAQYLEVDLAVETDADRRKDRWIAMADDCPFRTAIWCVIPEGPACDFKRCPGVYWAEGWR